MKRLASVLLAVSASLAAADPAPRIAGGSSITRTELMDGRVEIEARAKAGRLGKAYVLAVQKSPR